MQGTAAQFSSNVTSVNKTTGLIGVAGSRLKTTDATKGVINNNAEVSGVKESGGKFEVIPTGGNMYNMGGLGER